MFLFLGVFFIQKTKKVPPHRRTAEVYLAEICHESRRVGLPGAGPGTWGEIPWPSAMISTYGWEKTHAFFGNTQVSNAKIWGSSLNERFQTCPWIWDGEWLTRKKRFVLEHANGYVHLIQFLEILVACYLEIC